MKKNFTPKTKSPAQPILWKVLRTLPKIFGVSATRKIYRAAGSTLSLLSALQKAAVKYQDGRHCKTNKQIDFAGYGLITAWSLYSGFRKNKKSLIIQGALLSLGLAAVLLHEGKAHSHKVIQKSLPEPLQQ